MMRMSHPFSLIMERTASSLCTIIDSMAFVLKTNIAIFALIKNSPVMAEDPLERIEREERERKANGGLKTTLTILIIIALALAGVLGYMLYQRSQLVSQLEEEKTELAAQMSELQ